MNCGQSGGKLTNQRKKQSKTRMIQNVLRETKNARRTKFLTLRVNRALRRKFSTLNFCVKQTKNALRKRFIAIWKQVKHLRLNGGTLLKTKFRQKQIFVKTNIDQ